MVGTFYRAPTPEAPPFVEVGGVVSAGQPLCLIEVMKLFTTINSEVAGRIVQIGAENGELVEYGRTLFVIEQAGRGMRCRQLEGQKKQSDPIRSYSTFDQIKKVGRSEMQKQARTRLSAIAGATFADFHFGIGSSGGTELHRLGLAAAL